MKISKNAVPVKNDSAFGSGIVEILDVDIGEISGVLIQNNSLGRFVEVYDHSGSALFRVEVDTKDRKKVIAQL